MEAIFQNLRVQTNQSGKYVLDADIAGCFDNIDHDYLSERLQTLPGIQTQVQAWLKAGVMEGFQGEKQTVAYQDRGTPQGGPLSPLLSNIALHGLENQVKQWVETQPFKHYRSQGRRDKRRSLGVIRYADDLVVLHKDKSVVQAAKAETERWLAQTSKLSLKDAKTRIAYTKEGGFTFLGWQCIHLNRNGKFYVRIYPSKKALKNISLRAKQVIKRNRASSSYALIKQLRPVLIGWCNYHKYTTCSKAFKKLDHNMWSKLRHWVFRPGRKHNREKLKEIFFPSGQFYDYGGKTYQDNWVLVGTEKESKGKKRTNFLPKASWIEKKKYIKVQGTKSPYDGDHVYWGKRLNAYSGLSPGKQTLLKRQKGVCPICKQAFLWGDVWEVDHVVPKRYGGKDNYENLQLLHFHCHKLKTRQDQRKKA